MAPSQAPAGLRARKNRRTRRAIVRAAADLTIEGGYGSATIPRIAERADVSPRTVSAWFPSKDDILFERVDEYIARAVAHLRAGAGDVVDRLEGWVADEVDREHPDPELWGMRQAAIDHDPDLRAHERRHLERLQAEVARAAAADLGGDADDLGPQLFAGAAMSMLLGLRSAQAERTGDDAAAAGIATGFRFLRAGLATLTPPAG